MSGYIELHRSLLEECDIIEDAVAARVRRNVDVVPAESRPDDVKDLFSTKKRPWKETIQQQHEIKYFLDKSKRLKKELLDAKSDPLVRTELEAIFDSKNDFAEFDKLVDKITKHYDIKQKEPVPPRDVSSLYKMYSSAPESSISTTKKNRIKTQRKYVLSAVAAHLTAESLFSPEEGYGKYVDLRDIYPNYQQLTSMSYKQFLSELQDLKKPSHLNNKAYSDFLNKLVTKLEDFYDRQNPFKHLETELSKVTVQSNSESSSDPLYCQTCSKLFAKELVFNAHLSGKKHKKNAEKSNASSSESSLEEIKARKLCALLTQTLADTISNLDRQAALTEREKQIENMENDSEETVVQSSSSSDESESDEESAFANMPLGADGTPIPPWLFKLQGLHRSYECEVCGNISYKGRVAYDKHFGSTKHTQGLKLLGVEDDLIPLFKGISTIDEAVELWRKIKRASRLQEGERDNAEEVEDEAGNVMSKKDYLDLKKQGLL